MPVPVLVGSWHTIDGLVYSVPHSARELIRAFWPGALSLVVRQAPSLQWDLGETRGTVAVRMPDHDVALELLEPLDAEKIRRARLVAISVPMHTALRLGVRVAARGEA